MKAAWLAGFHNERGMDRVSSLMVFCLRKRAAAVRGGVCPVAGAHHLVAFLSSSGGGGCLGELGPARGFHLVASACPAGRPLRAGLGRGTEWVGADRSPCALD